MSITENRTLLQKADLALADLASGGLLRAAQADQFIRLAIRKSVLMGMVTVSPMGSFQEDRDKTRFASRVMRSGTEATALPVALRSKPDLARVTLDAKLFKAETRMSEEVLEDQIERGAFKDTVMQSLAAAIARDMESVAINGDTVSGSAFLTPLDGILKQATANIVDGLSARLNKTILKDVMKALDDEFANLEGLQFWTNRQARVDYRDSLADRATPLGDAALTSSGTTQYADIPITAVPEFPPTAETGGSVTQVLHTNGDNIVIGIYRKIKVEQQLDVPAGVLIVVSTLRWDVKILETSAAAKAINVLGT